MMRCSFACSTDACEFRHASLFLQGSHCPLGGLESGTNTGYTKFTVNFIDLVYWIKSPRSGQKDKYLFKEEVKREMEQPIIDWFY
jgi:hypothetical protein